MSGVILKRLPRPADEPRRYRVQIGEGRSARSLGYVEDHGDRWDAINTFRPRVQRVVTSHPSCKLAIKSLEHASAVEGVAA